MDHLRNIVHPLGDGPQFAFRTRSLEDRLGRMRAATEWLSSFGIDYYKTRIGKYFRDFDRLNNAIQNNSVDQLLDKGEFAELVNSLFESDELIAIYEGLGSFDTTYLAARLRDFVKGTEFANTELTKSSSNKGRDVGIELLTASLFARAGYQIDFGTNADIIARDDQNSYFVECKRPQFDHSVRANVRGAARQLRNRLGSSADANKSHGIIVLSTSKIVNPDMNLLVASTEERIESGLRSASDRFIIRHQRHWLNISDSKIVGVIMILQTPAVVENRKVITTCSLLSANNVLASGRAGVDCLKSVAARLKPALFGEPPSRIDT